MKVRLACIDMAGTVVRDDGMVMDAFRSAISYAGLSGAELEVAVYYAHETMGLPKFVVFKHIFGDEGRTASALACFGSLIADDIKKGRAQALPGATETLQELSGGGVGICLTTGFSPGVQGLLIEHLGWEKLVDLSLAPGPDLRGRPYPDMIWKAAIETGVEDIRQVAVAGDTANDLRSGWSAGAQVVVGVLTGSHGREELEQAPHSDIVASIADLPRVLDQVAA
ncbi:MAG TPA: HAD family hydrolase [Acidimicrobiales bacterium]|nr:HAD family hydrolase [Acidimicrobiales bacterium]